MSAALNAVVSRIERVTGISAHWHGDKARVASPLRQTNDRNVLISDGERSLRITDFAHRADVKDILESVGLSVAALYYEPLAPKQKQQKARDKSQRQIDNECVHAYLILIQLPNMWAQGIEPSSNDVESINKALRIIDKYQFTEADYDRIESARQAEVDTRLLRQREAVIDKAYELFRLRGGDHGIA